MPELSSTFCDLPSFNILSRIRAHIESPYNTIVDYSKEIFSLLPWEDDYRNYKANAFELELRDLQFLSQRIGLSVSDKQSVDLLKNARNTLAHNGILTKEQISAICNLR